MSTRAETVVLAILLGLVGVIIVGIFLSIGLFAVATVHSSSGGAVYVGTSCPPPPSATGASTGCTGD